MNVSACRMIVLLAGVFALLVMLRVPAEPTLQSSPALLASSTFETPITYETSTKVDFHRQVLPILADKCFPCHGPDAGSRKADLRLDTFEGVRAARKKGMPVVPGDASLSRMLHRIEDANDAMPPAPMDPLNGEEKSILRRWVEEGAVWGEHWSFTAPRRPQLPRTQRKGWARNAIDRFILATLEKQGLSPALEADQAALLRRLTLDLTGLPPTPEELDVFLHEASPEAYERVVDRLLASPRHAEHLARHWLDAARYGDTHGTHLDNYREAWPYRDWVIRAFHEKMPYDRFLTEQIAGDLLPGAGTSQRVATGFLRNQVSTGDLDSLRESEARFAQVAGIAEATATVTMGLTMACAKCHDHRYDPLTQKDYYRFFAYFNNNDGAPFDFGAPYPHPAVAVPSQDEIATDYNLRVAIAATEKSIQERVRKLPADLAMGPAKGAGNEPRDYVWLDDQPMRSEYVRFEAGIEDCFFAEAPEHPVRSGKHSLRMQGGNQQLFWVHKFQPTLIVDKDDVLFAYVWIDAAKPPRTMILEFLGNGWNHRAFWGEDLSYQGKLGTTTRQHMGPIPEVGKWVRLEVPAQHIGLMPGMEVTGVGFRQYQGGMYWDRVGLRTKLRLGRMDLPTFADWLAEQEAQQAHHLPATLAVSARKPAAERTDAELASLRDHYLSHDCPETRPQFGGLLSVLRQKELELHDLHANMPRSLVFQESAVKRATFFHTRGDWDKPTHEVSPGTPACLPALTATPGDRLGLAKWITHPEHPLTARVAVNRFWQILFGGGLVRTSEDFGKRGDLPTHPELLDWLAIDFRNHGWDVSRLLKQIVMSSTYRQSSHSTSESLRRDPENRWLSRSPRHRLDAETLRDQALSLGGQLVEKLGGPSVKPPQPPGMWELVATRNSNTKVFIADTDPQKAHRRSMYTFWKRTGHSPQMGILDAPSRETCVVRRERTNTPMQALLMMNEEQFFEAAQGLAKRSLSQGSVPERLTWMFRTATSRSPSKMEQAEMLTQFEGHRQHFATQKGSANPMGIDAEQTAMTMVAHLILNLDEVQCRP